MFDWFRKRKTQQSAAVPNRTGDAALDLAIRLQREYWAYNPVEKEALLARYPNSLTWPEILRLHHLVCLEMLTAPEGKAHWMLDGEEPLDRPDALANSLCQELGRKLMLQNSPYRARECDVWNGQAGCSGQREADFRGHLMNASLTHLGCLEVIRLDERQQPKELAFIPFDDMRGLLLAKPAIVRAAKVLYEHAGREEIVLVPLIYGISWFTAKEYDHDGAFTRFCCHQDVGGKTPRFGVGIGHQDLLLRDSAGKSALLGLGSVGEIIVALRLDDPKFEQKCKARGLDPAEVRRSFGRP